MDYFAQDKFIEPKKGDLLISKPYLPDPNFERTVVYLTEHDENGTFGLVLNKKSNMTIDSILDNVSQENIEVFIGGPVQKDTLHYLHREPSVSNAIRISEGIYRGGDFDQVLSMLNTKTLNPVNFRFFVGYSGWESNQLMDEIKAKSWIIYSNCTSEMVFDWDNQDLWRACLNAKGGKYKLIANYPVDPRLN